MMESLQPQQQQQQQQLQLGIGSKRKRDESIGGSSSNDRSNPTPNNVVDVDASSSGKAAGGSAPNVSPPVSRARGESESLHQTTSSSGAAGATTTADRRMRQPTLAVYGMISDTGALKKELSDRDSMIEELKGTVSSLEEELSRRDSHLAIADEQIKRTAGKLDHFREVMRDEMLKAAKAGRVEARRLLFQKHFELGQIVTWPGTGKEMWAEGNTMRDLIQQLNETKQRRDKAEALRQAAYRNSKPLRQDKDKDRGDSVGFEGQEALLDALEEYRLRCSEHTILNNRIAEIEQRMQALESEKKVFLKEIRRFNDEEASEFLAVPAIGENGRYVLMHLLGKGGFSEVWKAFDLVEGIYVACKIHSVKSEWNGQTRAHYLKHVERELEIMRQLQHPHLTQLYDVFQLNATMFVSVIEFSEGIDLDTYLKRYHRMKEADVRLVILQVVGALRYLSTLENPIIHYDLKPANILFHAADPNMLEVKITDFGLSKIIGTSREGPSDNPSIELTSQGTGTYWYLPPECFETSTTPRISNKVDVWAVGIICYQMLYGCRPFAEGKSQKAIWQEKLILSSARALTFPDTPSIGSDAKNFIERCLAFNVNERYDVAQMSRDPFLLRTNKRGK